MKERSIQVADELVCKLGEFGFPAVRTWQAYFDTEETAAAKIFVIAAGHEIEPADVDANRHDLQVRVVITKLIGDVFDDAEIDGVAAIAAKIKRLYDDPDQVDEENPHVGKLRRLPLAGAQWRGLQHNPIFEPERLSDQSQYLTQIVISYSANA
ncbi:MAG: hypothetical protein ACIALR_14840 [Blastopirellula sp. JB062]